MCRKTTRSTLYSLPACHACAGRQPIKSRAKRHAIQICFVDALERWRPLPQDLAPSLRRRVRRVCWVCSPSLVSSHVVPAHWFMPKFDSPTRLARSLALGSSTLSKRQSNFQTTVSLRPTTEASALSEYGELLTTRCSTIYNSAFGKSECHFKFSIESLVVTSHYFGREFFDLGGYRAFPDVVTLELKVMPLAFAGISR